MVYYSVSKNKKKKKLEQYCYIKFHGWVYRVNIFYDYIINKEVLVNTYI